MRRLPGRAPGIAVPPEGDIHIFSLGTLRGHSRSDLAELVSRPIHLELRFFDARIYAVRLDCGLWYTNTPAALERV